MSPAPVAQRSPIPPQSEEDFLQSVLHLARMFGWADFHVRDSRRSNPGWPDLALVKVGWNGVARYLAAELKTETGKVTPAQRAWLERLGKVPGIETYVWRPSDRQRIAEILSGRAA